ncbi:hypothetical protein P3T76_006561 [Phytophthora citrophthora]|uniref:RxLR effector protein n=1 Tax=Phytophthora citrophthora TaxID=4793 RepID=A0AAD9GPG6_9STRA|nr:hypothetical protein P3T76_006559 [Phytophthora citrophthora]KAK1942239.1 hypothetical protein P3T76_006561 [Phytophthora citrophthora]
MRLNFVLLLLGAVLLSVTSGTASTPVENKKDAVVPNVEGTRFLRGLETTDSEERWSITNTIRDLLGRGAFEKMLINNPAQLNKYSTKTIASKMKGTKYGAELLDYLNARSRAVRAGVF